MYDYKTEQENFWAGQFGDSYIERNRSRDIFASNIALFSKILSHTQKIKSIIEFGANIGLNLKALDLLLPQAELSAIEINEKAVKEMKKINNLKVYHQSLLNFSVDYKRDFVFTKGVLIHLNPDYLAEVYETLYKTSNRYICLIEYYNPTPVEVNYRGHEGKLFKRDFAGEMLDKYSDLKLINYGFVYHRDNIFKLDDATWFLREKNNECKDS